VGQLNQQHPTISTQIVRHIRDCLELAGIPSATLLDRHGIVPDTVDDRNDAVSLADYVRFFEDAAEEAGNPHFGMHAARVMSADGLGPLSFLFLSAPTLGQAFHTFTEHLDAMQEATFNAFIVEDSISHFTYGIRDDALAPRRQDSEYSIGVMCNLMRQYPRCISSTNEWARFHGMKATSIARSTSNSLITGYTCRWSSLTGDRRRSAQHCFQSSLTISRRECMSSQTGSTPSGGFAIF
jgi:hypothetical protein